LPSPNERKCIAYKLNEDGNEEEIELSTSDAKAPFIGLAFKLETTQYGQLTYIKIYQGSLKKNEMLYAKKSNKKFKITRLIRMHANEMEDVEEVYPGDIFCTFGLLVDTGETVTDGKLNVRMEKMFVPEPVMSMSLLLDDGKNIKKDFNKAIEKFTREDPTFTYEVDEETGEMIVKGMGELHLQIYSERLKREFNVKNQLGEPQVNYRETIGNRIDFNYLHKKQTGGAGQFGRVIGYFEPIDNEEIKKYNEFKDKTTGMNIPKE